MIYLSPKDSSAVKKLLLDLYDKDIKSDFDECLKAMKAGDMLTVYDFSSLSEDKLELFEILKKAACKKVDIHFHAYEKTLFFSIKSDTMHALSILKMIDLESASMRKATFVKVKARGVYKGRPTGSKSKKTQMLKCDKRRAEIDQLLSLGLSLKSISEKMGFSSATLYAYAKKKGMYYAFKKPF